MNTPSSLAARLNADIGDEDAWSQLTQALIADHQTAGVVEVLTARHQRRGDGASFAYAQTVALLRGGNHAAVERLAQEIPANSAFHALMLYALGLSLALRRRLDTASTTLRQGTRYCAQAAETVFANDSRFATAIIGQMLQQANLLEPSTYRPQHRLPQQQPHLPDRLPSSAGPLVVACCDERYLHAYADRFAATLAAACPATGALITVINPTAESEALRQNLTARFPLLAFASDSGPDLPAFYASHRFLTAEALLESTGRDLVLTDIDSAFPPDFSEIIAQTSRSPIAMIGKADAVEPSLRVYAALLGVRNGTPGRAFLRHAADYLRGKLAEETPVWTMDQAALFRALCLSRAEDCADLNVTLAGRFALPDAMVAAHSIPLAARMTDRGGHADYILRFDTDHRPLMSKAAPRLS
ncbi:MAG TPA: hypothetical protein VK558_18785 [Patescibacteria group bacterium]|nr:hypothetical protein [Patescibacteria group bacterium]